MGQNDNNWPPLYILGAAVEKEIVLHLSLWRTLYPYELNSQIDFDTLYALLERAKDRGMKVMWYPSPLTDDEIIDFYIPQGHNDEVDGSLTLGPFQWGKRQDSDIRSLLRSKLNVLDNVKVSSETSSEQDSKSNSSAAALLETSGNDDVRDDTVLSSTKNVSGNDSNQLVSKPVPDNEGNNESLSTGLDNPNDNVSSGMIQDDEADTRASVSEDDLIAAAPTATLQFGDWTVVDGVVMIHPQGEDEPRKCKNCKNNWSNCLNHKVIFQAYLRSVQSVSVGNDV